VRSHIKHGLQSRTMGSTMATATPAYCREALRLLRSTSLAPSSAQVDNDRLKPLASQLAQGAIGVDATLHCNIQIAQHAAQDSHDLWSEHSNNASDSSLDLSLCGELRDPIAEASIVPWAFEGSLGPRYGTPWSALYVYRRDDQCLSSMRGYGRNVRFPQLMAQGTEGDKLRENCNRPVPILSREGSRKKPNQIAISA